MFIPDPNCLHPGSRIRIKEFKYFNPKKPKNGFLALENMIRVVHPGSRIRMMTSTHPGSRIQGSKRHRIPDPGSRIRIRNTANLKGLGHETDSKSLTEVDRSRF
jgi:hypothetical protein